MVESELETRAQNSTCDREGSDLQRNSKHSANGLQRNGSKRSALTNSGKISFKTSSAREKRARAAIARLCEEEKSPESKCKRVGAGMSTFVAQN